jgi:hypothetical protein
MASTVFASRHSDQMRADGKTAGEAIAEAVAMKRAIKASLAGKSEIVAHEIGISPQMLRAAAQEDSATFLPLRRLPAFLKAAPDPLPLLVALAEHCGCAVFRLPVGLDAKPMADAMRQFADVLEAHAAGIEDGRWEPGEVDRLEREAQEAIAALLAAVAHARAASRRTA